MKAHLHYGENRSKQVVFKEQKKNILLLKKHNLARFLPQCKYRFSIEPSSVMFTNGCLPIF
jgi:hypothetical protein